LLQCHYAPHFGILRLPALLVPFFVGWYVGELNGEREMEHSGSGEVSLNAEREDLLLVGLDCRVVGFGSQLGCQHPNYEGGLTL
jgi:hypothetical protein